MVHIILIQWTEVLKVFKRRSTWEAHEKAITAFEFLIYVDLVFSYFFVFSVTSFTATFRLTREHWYFWFLSLHIILRMKRVWIFMKGIMLIQINISPIKRENSKKLLIVWFSWGTNISPTWKHGIFVLRILIKNIGRRESYWSKHQLWWKPWKVYELKTTSLC